MKELYFGFCGSYADPYLCISEDRENLKNEDCWLQTSIIPNGNLIYFEATNDSMKVQNTPFKELNDIKNYYKNNFNLDEIKQQIKELGEAEIYGDFGLDICLYDVPKSSDAFANKVISVIKNSYVDGDSTPVSAFINPKNKEKILGGRIQDIFTWDSKNEAINFKMLNKTLREALELNEDSVESIVKSYPWSEPILNNIISSFKNQGFEYILTEHPLDITIESADRRFKLTINIEDPHVINSYIDFSNGSYIDRRANIDTQIKLLPKYTSILQNLKSI